MDAKDLRTGAALGDRSNDGNTKYAQGGGALPCHKNKAYQDIGSNTVGKVDAPAARPCAVIGPDRVVQPPASSDTYLKKGPTEPWLAPDNTYRRPPDYPHKLLDYQHPSRNISPRQTFQENMQRIMVPPSYNATKLKEDHNFPGEATLSQMRNHKLNVPTDSNPKYCDVPYSVNPLSNDKKNDRNQDISVTNMNSVLARGAPHGWPSASSNVRPTKPYHQDLCQYPEYVGCTGPRPMMTRPHRTVHEEPGPVYPDAYYHDGNIRFKPYPSPPVKERYPQARYEYIGNYSNPFHPPPFPTHKYELQKPLPPHPYSSYPQVPLKYLDSRMAEPIMNGYQRSLNPQATYNAMPFRNQVIHPTYGPVPANCLPPNKYYPYPPEAAKAMASNKLPYDGNSKMYPEYESRSKHYPLSDLYINHPTKGPILPPNYPSNVHAVQTHPYYRKELLKGYDYSPHFRNMDPTLGLNGNHMSRFPSQFSPSTIAISPVDSNTSNETNQTQGTSQEDCGYVSQSSTASIRSIESGFNRMPPDIYRRYERYGHILNNSPVLSRLDQSRNGNTGAKDKKDIDVRQFLQMWNEGEDEGGENNNKEIVGKPIPNDANNSTKLSNYEAANQEQLYVLGLVNVPSEELDKYEHIQKVSKLPENIKGYNSIELLHQFEEVIGSSNLNHYNSKSPATKEFHGSLRGSVPMHGISIPSRPLSPLDVEAKISQSVIHKEVGCNFEIKPCSPKMLNVEVATPAHSVIGERMIEKVSNPLIHSPINSMVHKVNEGRDVCNIIKSQDLVPTHENSKIASCKMVNKPYGNKDSVDSVRTNYSIQDLESNSGVCLASLPRLDNDIELSFPEVNQQFINANKVESVITSGPTKDLPSLDIDQSDTINLKQETNMINSAFKNDADNDFPKLSKYRKIKRNGSEPNTVESNVQALRTDSVIIKNPDNCKGYDSMENILSPKIISREAQDDPINLSINTEHCADINAFNINFRPNQDKPSDFAIDFSINSNESCNFAKKSKLADKEDPVKSYDFERVDSVRDEKHKQDLTVIHERNEIAKSADSHDNFDRNINVYKESIFEPKTADVRRHSSDPQTEDAPKSKKKSNVALPNCNQSQKHKEVISQNSSQTLLPSLEKEDALNERMRELFGEEFTAVEAESSLHDLEPIHDTQAILDDNAVTSKDYVFSDESSQSNDQMSAGRPLSQNFKNLGSKILVEQAILNDDAVTVTGKSSMFSDESSQSCDGVIKDCSMSEQNLKDKKSSAMDEGTILNNDAVASSEKDNVLSDESSQSNDLVTAVCPTSKQSVKEKESIAMVVQAILDDDVVVNSLKGNVFSNGSSQHNGGVEADFSSSTHDAKKDGSTTMHEEAILNDDAALNAEKDTVVSAKTSQFNDEVEADCSSSKHNAKTYTSNIIYEQAILDDDAVVNAEKDTVFSNEFSQFDDGTEADCSSSKHYAKNVESTKIYEPVIKDDDAVINSENDNVFSDESYQSTDKVTAVRSKYEQNAKENKSATVDEQAILCDDVVNFEKDNVLSDESSQSHNGVPADCSSSKQNAIEKKITTMYESFQSNIGVTANSFMSGHNNNEESNTMGEQAVAVDDTFIYTEPEKPLSGKSSQGYYKVKADCSMPEQNSKEDKCITINDQSVLDVDAVANTEEDNVFSDESSQSYDGETTDCSISEYKEESKTDSEQETANQKNNDKDLNNLLEKASNVLKKTENGLRNEHPESEKSVNVKGHFNLSTTAYRSHVRKELMSPWIQKLIVNDEGACANVKSVKFASSAQNFNLDSRTFNKDLILKTECTDKDNERLENIKSNTSADALNKLKENENQKLVLTDNLNILETSSVNMFVETMKTSDNNETQKIESTVAEHIHTCDDYKSNENLALDEAPYVSGMAIVDENDELVKSNMPPKLQDLIDDSNIDGKQESSNEVIKLEVAFKNKLELEIENVSKDRKVETDKSISLEVNNHDVYNERLKIQTCSKSFVTDDVHKTTHKQKEPFFDSNNFIENESIVLLKETENVYTHLISETNLKNNLKDTNVSSNLSPSILCGVIVEKNQGQGNTNISECYSNNSFFSNVKNSSDEVLKPRKHTDCQSSTIIEKNSDIPITESEDKMQCFNSELGNLYNEDALSDRSNVQVICSANDEVMPEKMKELAPHINETEMNLKETDSWCDDACAISDFDSTSESIEPNLLLETEKHTKPVLDRVGNVDDVRKTENIFKEDILVSEKFNDSYLSEPICDIDKRHCRDSEQMITTDDYKKSFHRVVEIPSLQEEKQITEESSMDFEGKHMDSLISGSITNERNVLSQFDEETTEESADEVNILQDLSTNDIVTVTDKSENMLLGDSGIILEASDLQIEHDYEAENMETKETLPSDYRQSIRYSNRYLKTRRKSLKRSLSDSALDEIRDNSSEEPESELPLWPSKRKKEAQLNSDNTPQFIAENICHVIQNNRRNSFSSMQNEANVSFCILIDNNCIISEDCEDSDKICFSGAPNDCLACIQEESINEEDSSSEIISFHDDANSAYSTRIDPNYPQDDKFIEEPWVEDVACVETVVSDDIAENVIIGATTSPKSDEDNDDEEKEISNINEHTDKLKIIYGDKMYRDDSHFVDTLYRTPQMNVNKTLHDRESQNINDDCIQFNILNTEDGSRYYDQESLERLLSEPNVQEYAKTDSGTLSSRTPLPSPVISDMSPEDDETDRSDIQNMFRSDTPLFESKELYIENKIKNFEENDSFSNSMIDESKVDKINCCESSIDNVFTYEKAVDTPKCMISSSPEVSSTTSEEKNSGILLKITSYGGSMVSQVNDVSPVNRTSCKYTEKKEHLSSNGILPNRTWITKAAQKYIPPIKETIPDLKVQLPLPQQSLVKLRQLKLAKDALKPNIDKQVNKLRKDIPKKSKPKFEDVLKSIDEIQYQQHKEKNKKGKKSVPKVVIKKNENGSHYASTSGKDKFNPDLTGRKWQPWVFLEKDHFIDKMAVRKKTHAIYNHRKRTYVLAEKFKKYKSICSSKFVISQPKHNDSSSGQLKYTIRLKHSY